MPNDAYSTFRGPGDILKSQTEQHARDEAKLAGADKPATVTPVSSVAPTKPSYSAVREMRKNQ